MNLFAIIIVIGNMIAPYLILSLFIKERKILKISLTIIILVIQIGLFYSKYNDFALFSMIMLSFCVIALPFWHFFKRKKSIISFPLGKTSIKEGFIFKMKQDTLNLTNPNRGILIAGGAGSGKSQSFFEPIIKQIGNDGCYTGLCYDFKSPELSKLILSSYQNNEHQIKSYFIDFKNPLQSHRINPLHPDYLTSIAYVSEYSKTFINNLIPSSIKNPTFWDTNAQAVLEGIILYLRNNYPTYCSLPHVIAILIQHDIEFLIRKMTQDIEASGKLASLKQAVDSKANKMISGVMSTLITPLSTLNSPEVFWLLSGNDLNLDLNDPNDKKFLCLGNDATLADTYAPIISLIVSIAMRLMNQPHKTQSVLMLDEAPTIYIPGLDTIPATGRSNKIATIFGVQDYSQLKDKYGEDKAQVLLSNLGNQFYGRTVNTKSAEMVQKLFDKEDRTFESQSNNKGSSGGLFFTSNYSKGVSSSKSIQERNRVKISDLLNLKPGEFYGIIAEGNKHEVLKQQFNAESIKVDGINELLSFKTTSNDLKENYKRIISEAKNLFEKSESKNTPDNQEENEYLINL